MILLIDNFDSFTYNVAQGLQALGAEVKVVRNDAIDIAGMEALNPTALVISPGPGRPEDAGVSLAAIKHFAGKIPILGVCLGHQAIGQAFGAKIVQAQRIVHGKVEDISHDGKGLFRGIPLPSGFTRYHSLAIEEASLPAELEITARSPDGEIMGVRHKSLPIEGVQFHPDSIAAKDGQKLFANFLNYRREPFPLRALLSALASRKDLEEEQADAFMDELTSGALSDTQVAGFLMALETKGISAAELAGLVRVLRRKRVPITHRAPVADLVGTGGDGLGTFNISSLASLAAAACGVPMAKHGNRAVSSLSGAADFYAELGLDTTLPPSLSERLLEETGFAFLFAPLYHGAMKYAAPARAALGVKTAMNLVGPLSNPAAAEYQVIGVHRDDLRPIIGRAAQRVGCLRTLVIRSRDGMDEFSPAAPTEVFEIDQAGNEKEYTVDPAAMGIPPCKTEDVLGGNAARNAAIAREVISGTGTHRAILDAVALNAGAVLYAVGKAGGIKEGYDMALEAFRSGAVSRKLEEVKAASARLRASLG